LQATEHLFVLSAKTPARLWDAASTLTNWLRTNAIDNRFADAIYTWQTGRSAMQTRLALRVRDQADLSSKLGRWLADPDRTGSPSSDVSRDSADSALNRLWHSSAGQRWVVEALRARDLEQLALMWMAGLDVDWHGLYGGLEARHRPQRMSLPGYAFARDRHWIEATGAGACTSSGTSRTSGVLHPLLHANTSDFSCQSYRTRLTGEEFFLRDHRVRLPDEANETPRSAASVRLPAQRVLPAVAYLEMARQAVESALPFAGNAAAGSECPRFELRDTVWVRPFVVTQARQLSIVLRGDAQNHIEFELSSAGPAGEEVVYCQGRAVPAVAASVGRADINDLQSKLQQGVLQNEGLYEAFARMGFEYGPAHRVIQTLYEGDGQLLARVRLPAVVARTQPDYVLHPSLLDGALQAAIALLSGFETSPGSPLLPYAVRSLRLNSPCPPEMWVWARRNELEPGEVDMDLCHTSGEIAVQLRGFCAVRFGEAGRGSNPEGGLPAVEETVLAVPQWQLSEPKSNSTSYAGRHVLLCGLDLAKGGRVGDARTQIHTCPIPAGASLPELYREYARFCFKTVRSLLLTPSQDTVLIQVVAPDDGTATLAAGLSGLLESAALENPRLRGQVLLMDPLRPVADSTHLLELESRSSDLLVRHSSTQRWALGWTVVSQELPPAPLAWKNDGVYLITGGLGGLGTLLAREILSQVPRAKIVLTGRTQLNEAKRSVLDNLAPQQQIRYCSLDLTDCAKVHECVAGIVREHGQLNGILHCAGMIADDFIIRKSEADLLRVLAPKVDGTCHLDEASRDLQLDFFVLFSSVTAVVGMVGQADYAAANGFLDQFASHRDQLVAAGHRSGRTLSINWPLWQDGGMRMDPVNIESFRQRTGATPIRTGDALEAFYRALSLPASRCMVMRGEVSRLLHTLRSSGTIQEAAVPGQGAVIEPLRKSELLQRTEEFICLEFATVLKFPAHRVEPHATLEHYGIDSILAVSLIRQLEKSLGPLSKTLLFEYRSVRDLARHLVDVFPARLAARLSLAHAAPEMPRAVPLPRIDSAIHRRTAGSDTNRFRHSVGQASRPSRGPASLPSASAETIAIVGLSGRYPQSDTLEAYWENLRSGRDCIVEIPPDRWEWRHHYTPDRTRNGRHYSKWGGFISGVDEFDPRFFNIAPREAQFMDPQERLFLQHAWMAVEDAGYSRAMLQMPGEDELPGQVGVYVGVMWSEYQLHAAHADPEHQRMGFAGNLASIANRVSYVLNLHGPSVALDTMCSSSLTAIHFACQGLRDGATSMAIAGGVNVSIHPNKYLLLSVGQFISSDGRCQSFGEGGEGYIPGEGVGAVVLKRLSDAERDGDHVYGLIKGSALSHGGRTHGYTVPNPQAQASAIGRALTAANVQARHVSYVEAHGTGTKLGDPIEIAALARVFEKNTAERGFCLIGSAKSNIGHTEAAAGIAGLTKVLLQMQHRQIAPSLHSSRLNPHIDFAQSPFVVNQTLRAWERPVVSGQEQPRIAGVSSFGAGGANAHLIVQEYLPAPKPSAVPVIQPTTAPVAIVLSARTAADLSVKARQLLSFIRERALAEPQDLVRMAYTLQVGREPLEERLGLLAGSFSQLTEILARYGDAGAEKVPEGVYRGRAKSNRGVPTTSGSGAEELLRSWVSGTQVDWQTLYGGGRPQRMSLPTYPFAKERYWIDSNATGTSSTNASANSNANATNTANTINGTHGTASPAPATCRAAAQVRGISLEIPAELVARRADPGRRIAQPPVFRLTPLIQSDNLSAEVTFRRQEQGIFAIELAATRCHNRLDRALVEQLGRALAAAGGEPDLKVLLICGAEDCFACGGADSVDAAITGRLYESLAAFPYPTIAVLRGRATGAGFLLGAMCDFMICAEETFYGFTDPQTASLPSEPVARYFGARFGNALSRGLLYEATAVTGAELGRRLWSCTIVPAAQVLARGRELAGRLADKSPLALRLLKQHLAKPLRALVEELRAGDAVEPGQESGLPGGIAPARQSHPGSEGRPIEPESAGPGVKLVRLPANPAPQVLRSLITDLEFALRAVSEDATCKALVLTFTDDEPSSTTELEVSSSGDDELLELCNVLLSSAVPVVAAMTARTEGIAWFWSLYCDACIYGEEGTYSAARICASPNLQLKRGAAGAFAHRFDEVLAAELLLAGARFSGVELARRSGGLTVVPGSEVIPAAIALAQRWSRQTREMLVAWKRQAAREVQQRLLPVAYPESVSTARTRQGSEQGAVHSPVASASPRVIPLSTDVVTAVLSPEGVLEVVLADREAKNMFSEALITGVKEAFAYAADVPDCKVIVLRGYDRYFASGGTKESLLAIHAGKARFTDFEIFHLALDCPVPVVAAMQGHAIGAGWSLGMFADIPVLSADCRYVSPYMDYGFTPGAGATLIFPKRMGLDLARETLLTGTAFEGEQLQRRGSNLRVLAREEVVPTARSLALGIARQSRAALVSIKDVLARQTRNALPETYRGELAMHEETFVGQSSVRELIERRFPQAPQPLAAANTVAVEETSLHELSSRLRSLLARELRLPESDIADDVQFVDLGLDSISGVTWIRKINETYGLSVEAANVYSYPTLAQLSRHVGEEMAKSGRRTATVSAVAEGDPIPTNATTSRPAVTSAPAMSSMPAITSWPAMTPARVGLLSRAPPVQGHAAPEAIAIVGLAGQFPQARNPQEFWKNIASGRNCVVPIPPERWNVDAVYAPGSASPGTTNSKWMGALEDYDRFDPLFFNISPAEAESMDPQQRLFLQSCWNCIENAGYSAKALSATNCGVFVGCTQGDYQQLSSRHRLSAHGFTGGAPSVLAARISYFLNLQGPCISIDTACSSSLVALAQACDSLISRGSDMALAGGVFVMATAEMHIKTTQAGMLSSDGRCFSFDQRANGFVPGEAVGAVLLKRLSDAERDGDAIHAVIEGWGINQDGKSNGITAPNPQAQARLQRGVYERFNLDPGGIQLIEAHGTGTQLGDPIEVQGLVEAFGGFTRKAAYCALGSVKSNIGHCVTAAGIAGVIKMVLALKNRQLPPTINFEQLNAHISLDQSPFYVNTELRDWEPGNGLRRRGAVSSFGFSGTNAHLVIGEYTAPRAAPERACAGPTGPQCLLPLSAKTPAQLQQRVHDLLEFVRAVSGSEAPGRVALTDLAYTLQVGREPMAERLGLIVSSWQQLTDLLQALTAAKQPIASVFRGPSGNDPALGAIGRDDDIREAIMARCLSERKYAKLLELWTRGLEVDWAALYRDRRPQRVTLPEYPFARNRYWVEAAVQTVRHGSSPPGTELHPLLQTDTSDLTQHSFSATFSGAEPFLRDHRVRAESGGEDERPVLPGVAYLEMARTAIQHAAPAQGNAATLELHDTVWEVPCFVTAECHARIAIWPLEGDEIEYEIGSGAEGQDIVHCRGRARLCERMVPARVDLDELRGQMRRGELSGDAVYAAFSRMGLVYGPAHRGLTTIYQGQDQLLARLRLPDVVSGTEGHYVLHPSLMDAALQASIGLSSDIELLAGEPVLPFALRLARVTGGCCRDMLAWVRRVHGGFPGQTLEVDVDILDPDGHVRIEIQGLLLRTLRRDGSGARRTANVPDNEIFDEALYRQVTQRILDRELSVEEAAELH
jgi:acyl transferase domain-containing protein/acyl carrier protein